MANKNVETFTLRVSIACPSCREPMAVNRLALDAACPSCQTNHRLGRGFWETVCTREAFAHALSLDLGETRQATEFGGWETRHSMGRDVPQCAGCGEELDPTADELRCGGCDLVMPKRPASDLERELLSQLTHVLNESEPGDGSGAASFACTSCGAALETSRSSPDVRCAYCGATNRQADWRKGAQNAVLLYLLAELSKKQRRALLHYDDGDDDSAKMSITQMARSNDWEIRQQAARSRQCPPQLLEVLASDSDSDVRKAVAANPNLTAKLAGKVASDEYYGVRQALAANPIVPEEVLLALVADESDRDVINALSRRGLGPRLLEAMATASDSDARKVAAQSPAIEVRWLEELAHDDDYEVRVAVVNNLRTPQRTLVEIASSDHDSDVLKAMRKRPDVGQEVLRALACSDSNSAKAVAARHPDTPAKLLASMAAEWDNDVRRAVARHANTPPGTLVALGNDSDVGVARAAQNNANYAAARSRRLKIRLAGAAMLVFSALLVAGGTALVFLSMAALRWMGIIEGARPWQWF